MNADLLRKVADHILAEPRSYDQMNYYEPYSYNDDEGSCGTTACIAGWAAVLSSNTKKINANDISVVTIHGYNIDMDEYARIELGLTEAEALYLFGGAWLPKSLPRDEDGIPYRSQFSQEELAEHVAKALYKIASGGSVYDA